MPKSYVLECPPLCSFAPGSKWGIRVTEMMLDGAKYREIVEMAAKEGDKLFPGTISRHKKHIVITGRSAEDPAGSGAVKATNIEIIETIIQKGFSNSQNWKPTISDTMKAMDMWFRLTQGNPFDELLNTLAAASIGEDEPEETNPEAVSSVDEFVQADHDEGEVLVDAESA